LQRTDIRREGKPKFSYERWESISLGGAFVRSVLRKNAETRRLREGEDREKKERRDTRLLSRVEVLFDPELGLSQSPKLKHYQKQKLRRKREKVLFRLAS